MNNCMFAFLGWPEVFVIFLVLLVMAVMAAAGALLLVWLLRRNEKEPKATPSSQDGARSSPGPATPCPRCGALLPANSPQGLCPRCVMGVGLATHTEAPGEFGPHGTKVLKPAPPPEEIAKHFPQLEIMECLGRGGMGVVYKARQPKLNRLVALKLLAPEKGAEPKFAERFQREALALAKLSHPNIVAVHDFGEAEGMFYLLMEYVDGVSLRQTMREGRMRPEEALAIVPKICEALQFAHEQGVVHRDIKPENVLLDKQGRVKIADFGIAKIVADVGESVLAGPASGGADRLKPELQSLTQDQVLGTPNYMAPEQVEQPATVDHRADIYSLGVVFYEMLTGELPLGQFQPPSKKVHVDVRLDEVVLHALEKEPERRYQHARQVKTDVETIASGEATPVDNGAIARARQEVDAPAKWLVATGILNWITIPLMMLVVATLQRDDLRQALFWIVPASALVLSSAIILAGLKMKRLEAHHLAILGSGLAIFMSPGNIIGLPVGIWSLVVLCRRDVRSAFGKGNALPAREAGVAVPPVSRPDRFWRRFAVVTGLGLLALILIPVGMILLSIVLIPLSRAKQGPNVTLSGTVSDAATGKPIAGARVDDNRYGAARTPQQAWTDANGRYELRTWYEEHTISASAPGYAPSLQTLLTKPFGKETAVQVNFRLQAIPQLVPTGFDPVIERIVAGEGDANQRFIDFDTGRLFAAAEFFGAKDEPSPEETQAWWKRTGIDAVGDTSPAVRGMIGFEMVATPVPSEEWDRMPPARLDYYFALAKPGTPANLSGQGDLPATFAIKTREGAQGLLQITGFNENPPGVKLRYKLTGVGTPATP